MLFISNSFHRRKHSKYIPVYTDGSKTAGHDGLYVPDKESQCFKSEDVNSDHWTDDRSLGAVPAMSKAFVPRASDEEADITFALIQEKFEVSSQRSDFGVVSFKLFRNIIKIKFLSFP
ncbi:hypothetical protein TNCV_4467571 [Trichonephila clavipes]|nr:hypothetical protein TNCV_4467571 [Trichonephila clavipes]